MISDIDYMKLAMSQESDKTEIDPVLGSRAWSAVLVGLAMFWSIIALVVCNVWIIS
ncbi:TPA: YmiA family putative membrane protein [Raoultella ornithinolytica]